ncbi:CAP domain-containing protein [Ureibacillus manganicus]|uniref:SCP domain-containing protein n=1 Tax=Ureibacillus manganicus DSM 26584 TaxID=1384049 RepID=A0A0A3I249_9BACL|nr:CAP domain-containing protein [Ureibacillus manganicus]KGR78886.1 hypothetical protein CD29_09435 [Ureibacillus manganicus DSM 26584]
MKKIFIPFCALALFATQIPTANAASATNNLAINESFLFNAQAVNLDQYEEFIVNSIENLSASEGNQYESFNKKLTMTKNTLERLLNIELEQVVNLALHKIEVTSIVSKYQSTNENSNVIEKEKAEVKTSAAPKTEAKPNVTPKQTETAKTDVTPKQNTTTKAPVQQNEQPKQNNSNYYQTPSNNQQTNTKQEQVSKPTEPTSESAAVSNFERQVVELTNVERSKAGLAPLEIHSPLMNVAEAKSVDMSNNNYFSHTSPTYGSPFDQIKAAGISYRAAGENIAQGQRTPQQVVQAWMASPGHRQNILNPSYTHIGVGFVESGYYWTQQFIQL